MEESRQLISYVNNWFWSEAFWLPSNTTWKDLERTDEKFYPSSLDLWIPLPFAVGLFLLRLLWERFVAQPIGRIYKLAESPPRPVVQNESLENAFKKNKKVLPCQAELVGLSKQLDLSTRQIERWWRRRRAQSKPSEMQRFKETSWRFLFYFVAFYSGLYTLWDKAWMWDTKHCWYGYPHQVIDGDIWWYYMIELGFYWSLIISLFMDERRKDFKEMIIHHIATISLMAMSWSANMVRVGTLVLCVHDAVDYIMEGAKLAKYCRYNKFCDFLFVVFTVVWFITRLLIYPFRILWSTLFEATTIVGMAQIYYAYNALLCTLQVLHIFWFFTIMRMAYYYVIKGQVEKDGRSDTEPESETEDEDLDTKMSSKTSNEKHSAFNGYHRESCEANFEEKTRKPHSTINDNNNKNATRT